MVKIEKQLETQHRISIMREMCDKKLLGLEVGASFRPVAPRSKGYNIEIVDHASAEDLRKKYAGKDPAVVNNIEDVTYVWQGGSLVDLIGERERYSYIIASHVIEHTTDIVRFLQDCEALLKPDGVLILAVPDKRYCLDFFRPVSTSGEALAAHLEKRDRHSVATLLNHFSTVVRNGQKGSWNKSDPIMQMHLRFDMTQAMDMVAQSQSSGEYIDAHAWQFTPSSFQLLLSDLRSMKLTGLWEKRLIEGTSCEFFVQMSKAAQPEAQRIALLKAMHAEQLLVI
jgi:2-polyprenyl-3-methyl-5-hydroxy-6-metoxy-1,4-benzoquinol methylase